MGTGFRAKNKNQGIKDWELFKCVRKNWKYKYASYQMMMLYRESDVYSGWPAAFRSHLLYIK